VTTDSIYSDEGPVLRRLAALLATLALLIAAPAQSATSDRYQVAAQGVALAPNAGGQQAYSLKLAHGDWEAGAFSNQYVTAGSYPLSGGTFDWRFPVCDDQCFWQFFAQAGAGVSTGGPLAEITWGAVIPLIPLWLPTRAPPYLPALRIDITTQLIFVRWRAVTWSYPLWVGLSVPF
jgi:hypothetical protein